MSRQPVIGLEVHLQLKTATKIFCGCSTQFGAGPNSQVCVVCLGFPGVLPVLNKKVLDYGIRVSLALGCSIQEKIVFHRKNYFYPDLPKGYQISQYDLPLGTGGAIEIAPGEKIRIMRAHLEEDAGKLVHKPEESASLVDFNRGGVPLLEIVSEADLKSPEQAHHYLKTLKNILEYLDVSDCDMEKGSLRCDANVSLTGPDGKWGKKVEIKNLNSFKGVSHALTYEIQRQGRLLDAGETITQETRLWDDLAGQTQPMRSKEDAHDYRYFPEPDLVPFSVSVAEIEKARKLLPELPAQRAQRFVEQYALPPVDAAVITAARATADYYEDCVLKTVPDKRALFQKPLSNWILSDLAREMNERNIDSITAINFPPENLVELVALIDSGKISGKMAKDVFVEALKNGQSPSAVVQAKGLSQVTDPGAIRAAAETVIQENPKAVADYKQGKPSALMFLVGQLMKRMKGAASPPVAQAVFKELLDK